jgi:hypothetical protein
MNAPDIRTKHIEYKWNPENCFYYTLMVHYKFLIVKNEKEQIGPGQNSMLIAELRKRCYDTQEL